MAGQPLRLGPFVGGINTSSDPTAIADSELQDCVNMELDIDGSLVSRPPIQTAPDLSGSWTERIVLLGVGVFSSGIYLFGSNSNGLYYFFNNNWVLIQANFQAVDCVQYADVVYFLHYPRVGVSPLAKWSPTGGFSTISNANLDTMLGAFPGGGALTIFKERLFICPGRNKPSNNSRLIFSDPGNPEAYSTTTQFIDVKPGDGQKLICAVPYDDNLILFKNDSTYVLSYTSKPADAELLAINGTIGASQERCVVPYENSLFIYHEGWVYEMTNYNFNRINTKVPFVLDTTTPDTRAEEVFLCRMGDRLIVRYYNRIYVFGLRTRTWSRWESADTNLHNFGPLVSMPNGLSHAANEAYYAGSSILSNKKVYLIKDGFSSTDVEKNGSTSVPIKCRINTKNYDLANSHQFKKLNWWGADVVANQSVTGTANPVIFGFIPTWEMLANQNKIWSDLSSTTWATTASSASVSSTVSASGSGTLRRFLRFPKALRFRQISFQVELQTDGSTADGPVKIFSLTIYAATKQTMTKAVN